MLINNQECNPPKLRRIEDFSEKNPPVKNKATEFQISLNQSDRINYPMVSLPPELMPVYTKILSLQELLLSPLELFNKGQRAGLNRKLLVWENLRLALRQTLDPRQEIWLKEKTSRILQNLSLELANKIKVSELNKLLETQNPGKIKELQNVIRSQQNSIVYIPHQEAERLIEELTVIAKNMQSQDVTIRIKNQDLLKIDDRSLLKVGAIPANFILQNRKAVKFLANNLGDATIGIALERGGAFQLDLIKALLPELQIRKIPKFTESMRDEFELLDAIKELPGEAWESKYKLLEKKLSKKKLTSDREPMKNEHCERLIKVMKEAIVKGHKTIALVETMISGDSLKHLIKSVQSLVPVYPGIKFNILIQQDTLQLKGCYGHESAYPLKYEGISIPISPGRSINIKALDNKFDNASLGEYGKIAIANGNQKKDESSLNYILAEDVDYQLKTDSHNAYRPVIVFDPDNRNTVCFQPSGGSTARDVVQNLISGQYDLVLEQNGIFLDKSNDTLTSTNEMISASNSLKTSRYSFFHHQKVPSKQEGESNDASARPSRTC